MKATKERINHTDGIITISDENSTIGYCRYDPSGTIEYLFVNPAFRRRGYAASMLRIVETRLGTALRFSPPISPLGQHVVDAYTRRHPAVTGDDDGDTPLPGRDRGRTIRAAC